MSVASGPCCKRILKGTNRTRRHLREAAEKLYEMNKCLSLVHLTRRHGAPERELILSLALQALSYSIDTRAFTTIFCEYTSLEMRWRCPPSDSFDSTSLTTTNLLRCLTTRRRLVQLLLQLQELT